MSKKILKVFAVDDGHFNNKGARIQSGEVSKVLAPTLISTAKNGFEALGQQDAFHCYDTEHQIGDIKKTKSFTILEDIIPGQSASLIETNTNKYQTSAPARVMVSHTLKLLGAKQADNIVLVTSSPIKRFYNNGKINQEYILDRQENLTKSVFIEGQDEPMLQIVKCLEVPEALGAFYNDCIKMSNKNGKLKLNMDEDIIKMTSLYIDIGGRTIDTGVVAAGGISSDECRTFEDSGMLAIHNKIRTSLRSYRDNVTRMELDKIIETGIFVPDMRSPKTQNVSDIVNQAIEDVMENTIDSILETYNFKEFNRIKFTGGTSSRLSSFIKKYVPTAEISESALYDNVIGMAKFGEIQKNSIIDELGK